VDEARQRYSDATRDVSQLERYLDDVRVALKALERETTATQVAAADALACIMGKGASSSCCPAHYLPSLIFL
jgi:DNA repair exonuclease SbcCD ATPase subunit